VRTRTHAIGRAGSPSSVSAVVDPAARVRILERCVAPYKVPQADGGEIQHDVVLALEVDAVRSGEADQRLSRHLAFSIPGHRMGQATSSR
jgi:hypothetical protein